MAVHVLLVRNRGVVHPIAVRVPGAGPTMTPTAPPASGGDTEAGVPADFTPEEGR